MGSARIQALVGYVSAKFGGTYIMSTKKDPKAASGSRKASANRQNSLKSTGPRTPEGKRMVRSNAMTHGLLAKQVVIKTGDGKESAAEFKRLIENFRLDLQPVGVLEETQVELIVVCLWRLRRVLRCETGEIRSKLDNARSRKFIRQAESLEFDLGFPIDAVRRKRLKRSSSGVRFLLSLLDRAYKELEETGLVDNKTIDLLSKCLGDSENSVAGLCTRYDPTGCPENKGDDSTVSKGDIFEAIDWEKTLLEELLEVLQENEAMELDAKIASLHLPDKDTTEKLLRYETALAKQLDRAITLLHTLQKRGGK
jgi:hypothetical protein